MAFVIFFFIHTEFLLSFTPSLRLVFYCIPSLSCTPRPGWVGAVSTPANLLILKRQLGVAITTY